MDNIIKFQIAEKRGLKSRNRRRKFLHLKHIEKAAKERKSHEPRLRSTPQITKLPPKMIPPKIIKVSNVKPKVKSSKFKNICKKLSAIFATKKSKLKN